MGAVHLSAHEAAYNFSSTDRPVNLTGNLKLGNFTLEFTGEEKEKKRGRSLY